MRKTSFYAMTAAAALTMSGAGFITSQAAMKGVTVKAYTGNCTLTGNNPLKDYSQIISGLIGNGNGNGNSNIICPDSSFPGIVLPGGMLPDIGVPDNNLPNVPDQNFPDQNVPDNSLPDQDNGIQNENTSSYIKQVVNLVNEERAKAGLSPLSIDSKTESAAAVRAKEIQRSFSHTRPDGKDFSSVLKEYGVSYQAAGENIAYGQRSPKDVMESWMNSSGHRANILNPNFGKIGVGYAQDGNGTGYWVQLFTN